MLVTNAINIAQELAVRKHLQLVVTGGVVRPASSWSDPRGEQLLAQIRIDTLFLGVNAVSARDGAVTHDESEAWIQRPAHGTLHPGRRRGRRGEDRCQRVRGRRCRDTLVAADSAADPTTLKEALRESGVRIHLADLDPVHQEAEQA